MKSKLIAAILVASQFALWGCYMEGPDYTEELDLVYTNYDNRFNFAGENVYVMPDEIVKITGDIDAPPEYINSIYAGPILANIEANMQSLGWTRKTMSEVDPDTVIHLLPAAWTTTTLVGGYWGGYYCWYYPYYCGGGWYYPYYPVSSYTTGTLVMTLVDHQSPSTDDSKLVVWTGAINGLLSGTYEIDRITKGIDQAFTQSPYLKTN